MTLNEASTILRGLIAQTDKKSELKVYRNFLAVLTSLLNRELEEEDIRSIEEELESLKLNEYSGKRRIYMKRKLNVFKKFLMNHLSLISDGYYTAIGMILGMCFGVAFGSAFSEGSGITIGVSIGMLIGIVIGQNMDSHAEKEGRVLKTSLT